MDLNQSRAVGGNIWDPFINFMIKKPKICNIIFWIEIDHPSFGTFPKIHPVLVAGPFPQID